MTKLSSRKFIVFIVASVVLGASLVYAFIAHDTTLAMRALSVWCVVSAVYLGANVVQKIFTNEAIIGALRGLKGE